MDEKSDEIIGQIEARRDELGRNLSELENKVRQTTDWHTHFENNPMLMLGAALGGGILVGAMVGGSRSSKSQTRGIKPWKETSSSTSGAGKSAHSTPSSYYTPSQSYEGLSAKGSQSSNKPSFLASGQMKQVGEALDHIKGALIAFGISKTKEFLAQAVPGIENHLGEFGKSHSDADKHQYDKQAKPYSTGSATPGNTGRPSEAEEYAGAGRTNQTP